MLQGERLRRWVQDEDSGRSVLVDVPELDRKNEIDQVGYQTWSYVTLVLVDWGICRTSPSQTAFLYGLAQTRI